MSEIDNKPDIGTVPIPVQDQENRYAILLVIHGLVQRVIMGNRLTLGRKDNPDADQPDFDLTPFGGVERGVSRVHACLEIRDGTLHIVDLGSTNGTYLNDERLEPNTPIALDRWNDLSLATLPMCVLYK